MPSSGPHESDELTSALQEQSHVQEEIRTIQQTISRDDIWLSMNTPATEDYQEVLEELLALQTYLAQLRAQAASLETTVQDLMVQASWHDPDLLLVS